MARGVAEFWNRIGADARRAIGLTAVVMNFEHLLFKLLVLLSPSARRRLPLAPVVITAGRNLKGLAHGTDAMVLAHSLDPLVALGGGSEMMPKVFFRISRCSRSSSFSRWSFLI